MKKKIFFYTSYVIERHDVKWHDKEETRAVWPTENSWEVKIKASFNMGWESSEFIFMAAVNGLKWAFILWASGKKKSR